MKIQRTLLNQKIIQRKIEKRTADKLKQIKIYSNLSNKGDLEFLTKNKLALASFAALNAVGLSFKNGTGLFKDQTIMEVYKSDYKTSSGELPVDYMTYEYLGYAFPNINKKDDTNKTLQSIKDATKEIASKFEKDEKRPFALLENTRCYFFDSGKNQPEIKQENNIEKIIITG